MLAKVDARAVPDAIIVPFGAPLGRLPWISAVMVAPVGHTRFDGRTPINRPVIPVLTR